MRSAHYGRGSLTKYVTLWKGEKRYGAHSCVACHTSSDGGGGETASAT